MSKWGSKKMRCLTAILAAPIVWNPLFEANVFSFGKRARERARALDARVVARRA
jgi:hypothetical protein